MPERMTMPVSLVGLPLRALRIEVLSGPDKGLQFTSQTETITVGTAEGNDVRLTDPTVSRYHLELTRRGGRVQVVDHGSTNGVGLGEARIQQGSIAAGTTLTLGQTSLKVDDGKTVTVELQNEETLGELRGGSPAMRRLMARIQRVAASDAAVLISGESGAGKELAAQAIHDLSRRADKPFVTVDCGAIAASLVQSELFGHERGAFTGADRRHEGAFERAVGGTLFLDEVGELPPGIQATLLGALERRRLRRLGGTEEVPVDVRVLSATNRDLRADVNAGSFRLDLFYRLAVTSLEVPPLRDRPEDIPLLVEHFLRDAGHTGKLEDVFPPATMKAFEAYRWPGNVRELRNAVESTLATGEPPTAPGPGAPGSVEAVLDGTYGQAREELLTRFEKTYLAQLLKRSEGNVSLASRLAQVDRTHLMRLMKKHGLK